MAFISLHISGHGAEDSHHLHHLLYIYVSLTLQAMEQQTISVAKAGITTILNSRAAVLAAANPVFGRYDDNRSAADNIDLLPTILSRFDMVRRCVRCRYCVSW